MRWHVLSPPRHRIVHTQNYTIHPPLLPPLPSVPCTFIAIQIQPFPISSTRVDLHLHRMRDLSNRLFCLYIASIENGGPSGIVVRLHYNTIAKAMLASSKIGGFCRCKTGWRKANIDSVKFAQQSDTSWRDYTKLNCSRQETEGMCQWWVRTRTLCKTLDMSLYCTTGRKRDYCRRRGRDPRLGVYSEARRVLVSRKKKIGYGSYDGKGDNRCHAENYMPRIFLIPNVTTVGFKEPFGQNKKGTWVLRKNKFVVFTPAALFIVQ